VEAPDTNPRQVTESSAQALFQAAAYPEKHRRSRMRPGDVPPRGKGK
jgi:hypothetical protein